MQNYHASFENAVGNKDRNDGDLCLNLEFSVKS